jgi:hypothetical protein
MRAKDIPLFLLNSDSLGAFKNKLAVDYPGIMEENDQHFFDTIFATFLLTGRVPSTPFHALSFVFRLEMKTQTSLSSHSSLQHFTILVTKLD